MVGGPPTQAYPRRLETKIRHREHYPSGRYTTTILFEYETQIPEKVKPVKPVGLDYASHGLYVSSDGEHAEYPGYYRKMQDKLAREQCRLSHMVKGSANWHKQCKRVARLYEKTANQRRAYQHKKADRIVALYDMVGVEALSMEKAWMRKYEPKPDPEREGHYLPNGRKARKGLAKSTSDNGYGMFCTMLEYKLARQGKRLVHVDKSVSVQPTMPRLRLQESSGQGFKRPRMGVPIMWSVA